MTQLSESFYIGAAGIGCGAFIAALWYARSILMTSRCQEAKLCGCCWWKNAPLSDEELTNVLQIDKPPNLPPTENASVKIQPPAKSRFYEEHP